MTVDGFDPIELVEGLSRDERRAIAEGDWSELEEILERQRALWQKLTDRTSDGPAGAPPEIAAALKMLYRVRRQNHALIERSFAEVRHQLSVARTGTGARHAYLDAASRAA